MVWCENSSISAVSSILIDNATFSVTWLSFSSFLLLYLNFSRSSLLLTSINKSLSFIDPVSWFNWFFKFLRINISQNLILHVTHVSMKATSRDHDQTNMKSSCLLVPVKVKKPQNLQMGFIHIFLTDSCIFTWSVLYKT